jgi:hypothetical protein
MEDRDQQEGNAFYGSDVEIAEGRVSERTPIVVLSTAVSPERTIRWKNV